MITHSDGDAEQAGFGDVDTLEEKPPANKGEILFSAEPNDLVRAVADAQARLTESERQELREVRALNKSLEEKDRQVKAQARATRDEPLAAATPAPPRVKGAFLTEKFRTSRQDDVPSSSVSHVSSPGVEVGAVVVSSRSLEPHSALLVEASVIHQDSSVHHESPIFQDGDGPDSGPVFLAEPLDPKSCPKLFFAWLATAKGAMLCFAIVVVLAGVITAGIVCGVGTCTVRNSNNDDSSGTPQTPTPTTMLYVGPTATPTTIPSVDPTAEATVDPLLMLLPETTQIRLQDPFSAQYNSFYWLKRHPLIQTLPDWRKQQLFALSTIFYSIAIDGGWSQETNYHSYNASTCAWRGIQCDGNGEVQSIVLGDSDSQPVMGLQGFMPPEIAMLSSLKSLSITNTDLQAAASDILITEIGLLPSLQSLRLTRNELSGTIPTVIGSFSSLEFFSAGFNKLSGTIPTEVGQLPLLETFEVARGGLTGPIPSEFGLATSLQGLWMDSQKLSSSLPTELGLLTSLVTLFFHSNSLTGSLPTEMGGMVSLERCILFRNFLRGTIPTELGLLSSLRILQLECNDIVGAVGSEVCLLSLNVFRMDCETVTCPSECGCQCNGADGNDCIMVYL